MDYFNRLTHSDNPLVAILAALVIVLAAVVVYQQRYTQNNTVPKWIFDDLAGTIKGIAQTQIEQGGVIKSIYDQVIKGK